MNYQYHLFYIKDYEALLKIQMEFRQTLLLLANELNFDDITPDLEDLLLACSFDGQSCNQRSKNTKIKASML